MAIQIWEDNPEYKVTANSITASYNIVGAVGMTWDQVRAALLAFAPISNIPAGHPYQWPRRGIDGQEVEAKSGQWKATVTWAALTNQYTMKIGGQQQQIRCSYNVAQAYKGTQYVPAQVGSNVPGVAIGWDGRTVHGASIYVPQRTWTESVMIPVGQYTFDYEDTVFDIQKSPVNSVDFRGYAPGEVLFLG